MWHLGGYALTQRSALWDGYADRHKALVPPKFPEIGQRYRGGMTIEENDVDAVGMAIEAEATKIVVVAGGRRALLVTRASQILANRWGWIVLVDVGSRRCRPSVERIAVAENWHGAGAAETGR